MKAVSQKMCVQNILMKFTSGANGERKMVGITSTVMEDFMHLFMNTEPMAKRFKYEVGTLYDKPCHMYNVGAMMKYMDYTPRTLEEIIRKEQNK